MTELQRAELKVLELVGSINLRPTLDRAAELGEKLCEVKALVPHGEWLPWLRRVKLNDRTARNYMTVHREIGNRQATASMTIEQFLACLREARIQGKKKERDKVREEVAARLGTMPDSVMLMYKDCRKFDWPVLDCVCTDPQWNDMASYRWLATMASEQLRPGGVVLLQVGTGYLAEVLAMMTGAGLSYRWTFSVVYAEARRAKPTAGRYLAAWNPILLFTKGELEPGDAVGDVYTVRQARDTKILHDWASPLESVKYFLQRLVRPGALVGDPFAGSGTVGVACHQCGLRYIGTEKDQKTFKVARGRLLDQGQHIGKVSTKA